MDVLRSVSYERICEMRSSGNLIYSRYLSSMERITLTALVKAIILYNNLCMIVINNIYVIFKRIINDRVFPHQARTYSEWNDPL